MKKYGFSRVDGDGFVGSNVGTDIWGLGPNLYRFFWKDFEELSVTIHSLVTQLSKISYLE
jgi:hypothetical protein